MQELEAEVKAILLTVQHAPDFQLHHGVAASGPRLQAARCSWQLYSELLEAVLAVAQPELLNKQQNAPGSLQAIT